MGVRLIFSFDSEDFLTPAAADAEKWWAEVMRKHGITACFCLVGELVRQLHRWGRQDVLAAIAAHEIAYHSDKHSVPPTWAEQLDKCGWEDGIACILQSETGSIAFLRETFRQHPSAWCKPGNSWGAQVAAAMALLDIPVFCDSPFAPQRGQPFWFANNLLLQYHTSFDRYFDVSPSERLQRMQADFLALCDAHDGGYLTIFTHPCRLVAADFWDAVNFRGGQALPRSQWRPAPLRPPEEVAALQRDFDRFLAWVVQQPQVELTTYRQLFAEYRPRPLRSLPFKEVLPLAERVSAFTAQFVDNDVLSPAEQFGVIVRSLRHLGQMGQEPSTVLVRSLFGPPRQPPTEIPQGEAPLPALLEAAAWADEVVSQKGCVPAAIPLGQQEVGPNAFMQAAARALLYWRTHHRLPASISLHPTMEVPPVANEAQFRNYRFKGTWVIFPPDFEGQRTLEHIRLQTWTIKPAVPTSAIKHRNDGAAGR